MNKGVPRPRRAVKEERIAAKLRNRIVRGEFAIGERLPTRAKIERSYRASPQTVQRAMDRLRQDGFIETRGKGGTRVAKHPPHLFRYGFVTGSGPQDAAHWPSHYFQRFLFEEAQALHRGGKAWLSTYTMVDWHVHTDDSVRLLGDIERHCLAGLILDTPTFVVGNLVGALLDNPNLPAVTICAGTHHPNLSVVNTDSAAVVEMALDHFEYTGRKRVALLSTGIAPGVIEQFETGIARRGLETRRSWLQYVVPAGAGGAAALCELLMEGRERPDALLIADDCLVEPATRGLAAAGVTSDHDMAVVAQANFPRLPVTHVPVRWLGFDVPEVVRTCLHILQERRAGRQVSPVTTLAPHWQHDEEQSLVAVGAMAGEDWT